LELLMATVVRVLGEGKNTKNPRSKI